MKKKSENKKLSTQESMPDNQVDKEMSDEEFDRYIDGIMVEEQEAVEEATDNQSPMADEVQSLREDLNSLLENFNALFEFVHQVKNPEANIPAISVKAAPVMPKDKTVHIPLEQQPVAAPMNEAEKARLFDSLMAEKKRHEIFRNHMAEQEADIKKDFTDFDFNTLYDSDPVFRAEFDRLGSLYGAYLKYLANKLAAGNYQSVRSFVENGAMPAMATGSISTSPAGLPDKEFEEYIRNIMGE